MPIAPDQVYRIPDPNAGLLGTCDRVRIAAVGLVKLEWHKENQDAATVTYITPELLQNAIDKGLLVLT